MFRSTTAEASVEQGVPLRIPSDGVDPSAPQALPGGSPDGGAGAVGVAADPPPLPPHAVERAMQIIATVSRAGMVTVL